MAREVYRDTNLKVPITDVIQFGSKVHSKDADWTALEQPLKEKDWYVEAQSAPKVLNKDWLVGIEVEVENVNLNQFQSWVQNHNYPFWTPKADNSLRNNGMEFISPPMRGERIARSLLALKASLGPKVDFSTRTSIHVHLNVRDLTLEQLVSLALVYATVERLLFRWVGQNREKNIFCVPMYNTRDLAGLYESVLAKLKKGISYKYSALNMNTCCIHHDVPLYGTVEFRHMYGTLDVPKLITWINFIFSIKKMAMARPLEDLQDRILSLNTTSAYGLFVKQVFGDYANDLLFTLAHPDQLLHLMEGPVMEIKRSTFLNPFHKHFFAGYPAAKSPFVKGLRKHYGAFSIDSAKKPFGGSTNEAPTPADVGFATEAPPDVLMAGWGPGPDEDDEEHP